jgi:hypothetical protein
MKYVCDAPHHKTWFQFETEVEADRESASMDHAVAKYFQRERTKAAQSHRPSSKISFEQNIGREAHIRRQMPLFLTLRDAEGNGASAWQWRRVPGRRRALGERAALGGRRAWRTAMLPIRMRQAWNPIGAYEYLSSPVGSPNCRRHIGA